MCWSGICLDPAVGVIGPMWIAGGTMNTAVNAKLIQDVVTEKPAVLNKIFQQDNAPCHRRENVLPMLQELGVKPDHTPYIIEWWPPQSPDLSPIENFWSWIDRIKRSVAFEMGLDRMKSVVNNIMWGRDPTTGAECADASKKLQSYLALYCINSRLGAIKPHRAPRTIRTQSGSSC
eukprot:GILJ01023979.1.p1 GENE.GILJ01023979.1~~GILJ01023979.1.p1  ORF type:complete len:176 (+),score=8.67 GILJ01023979.1:74-601(+)